MQQNLHSSYFQKNEKTTPVSKLKYKDKFILNIAYILIAIGCILIVSSSYNAAKVYSLSSNHFYKKHILFAFLSMILMNIFANQEKHLPIIGKIIWGLSIIGLILALIKGNSIKGASRWINFFGISIQPAEFTKIGVLLLGSEYVEVNWQKFFLTYLIPLSLIILQPDLGTTLLMLSLAASQAIIKRFNLKFFILSISCAAGLIITSYYSFDHVQKRINIFLNPKNDPFGAGYQKNKCSLAMQNGGWFGKGFGKGVAKDQLPDSHTDFIFAVIIEEFGFFGGLLIILLFMSLGLRVLFCKTSDEHALMIQYSFITLILAQSWLNIASNLGLIPAKGLVLPLISYGGSALISQGIIFGIILSTCKKTRILEEL